MTKDQLEAIRRRVHNKDWMDPVDGIDSNQPRIDRAALLEEVDRLAPIAAAVAALDPILDDDDRCCIFCGKYPDVPEWRGTAEGGHDSDCPWLAAQTDPA